MKKVLLSGLVLGTAVLAGCYTDPTWDGVGEGAASRSAYGQKYVGEHGVGDRAGGGERDDQREVEVEIPVALIGLNSRDKLKVVVPTAGGFDAMEIDLRTVTLGDGRGPDTRVLRKKNGALMARLEDEDGDGDLDLVIHFAVEDLVANGDLTENSAELVLEAATHTGPAVRGSAPVTTRYIEPKALLPPSRIDTPMRIALFQAVPAVWQEV
ncbi:MAG: hypothetical protein PVG79_01280 [Gemmatimonadales bacterium]